MSPTHRAAMLYAQAVDMHRSGQTDKARAVFKRAKAIKEQIKHRTCHWCGSRASHVLTEDSPQGTDYACSDCEATYACQYDRSEAIA